MLLCLGLKLATSVMGMVVLWLVIFWILQVHVSALFVLVAVCGLLQCHLDFGKAESRPGEPSCDKRQSSFSSQLSSGEAAAPRTGPSRILILRFFCGLGRFRGAVEAAGLVH